MESINNIGEGAANPFARSGLVRSPTLQTQQAHQQHECEQEQINVQQQQQFSMWSKVPKLPKVVTAKKFVEELHEYVDKRSNVHKDIKLLVTKIQGALGAAVKEWKTLEARADTAEKELAVTKSALEAMRASASREVETSTVTGEAPVTNKNVSSVQTTPFFTPKRARASPEDVRPGGPKKHKDTPGTGVYPTTEEATEKSSIIPWQVVGKKKERTSKKNPSENRV